MIPGAPFSGPVTIAYRPLYTLTADWKMARQKNLARLSG